MGLLRLLKGFWKNEKTMLLSLEFHFVKPFQPHFFKGFSQKKEGENNVGFIFFLAGSMRLHRLLLRLQRLQLLLFQ